MLMRLEDAAIKYINREPRPIDVQTIDQLTKHNEGLQSKIQEMTVTKFNLVRTA
jgi:hypothetical protein